MLLFAKEDEAAILLLVIIKPCAQLVKFHIEGDALHGGYIKHVGKPGVTDSENLLYDLSVHLAHRLSKQPIR